MGSASSPIDRGDAYITKVIDLSDDLDAIHGHLMGFQADGGGDFPESVNQALNEAVTKVSWSKDKKTLRMIFLVGDAPPHMDYPDDVKYPVTCKLALERDIIINAVEVRQRRLDQEILARNQQERRKGRMCRSTPRAARSSPRDAFDAELAKINVEINSERWSCMGAKGFRSQTRRSST